jgi:hypothetical protein
VTSTRVLENWQPNVKDCELTREGEAEQHHIFALEQYSKAIKDMKEEIFAEKHDLRTILLASLLIICFEIYHGNFQAVSLMRKLDREAQWSDSALESVMCNSEQNYAGRCSVAHHSSPVAASS